MTDTASADRRVPDPAVDPTVTVEEAGDALGISRATAYEGVRSGEIPSIRIGRRIVVPTAALRRLLELDTPNGAA
jgi:excisionase family DNA binding protein